MRLPSKRVAVGLALSGIVVIVAVACLTVTYNVAVNVVREVSHRLAESLAQPAAAHISLHMNVTERSLLALRKMALNFSLPIDDESPNWQNKWIIPMRALMQQASNDFPSFAVLTDDGGLVAIGTWWANPQYLYEYALDPRTLAATGSSTVVGLSVRNKVTNVPWDAATQGPTFKPLFYGDLRSVNKNAYYKVKASEPNQYEHTFDTYAYTTAGDYNIIATMHMHNSSGHFLGFGTLTRRLAGVDSFLSNLTATRNTQMFIIDNELRLIASSFSAPFGHYYAPGQNPNAVDGAHGCVTSEKTSEGYANRIGCRDLASDYAYAPLALVAARRPALLNQSGVEQGYGIFDGAAYYYISIRIPTQFARLTMNLVLFLPESDVMGDLGRVVILTAIVCIGVFVVAIAFANLMLFVLFPSAKRFERLGTNPAAQTEQRVSTAALYVDDDAAVELEARDGETDERDLSVLAQSRTRSLAQSERRGISAWLQLGSMTVCCSVLYADVVGFSALCDTVAQERLSDLLQRYFRRSAAVVRGHGGLVDRYVGDCVMAVFGAPVAIERHETRAALCAKQLAHEMATLAALATGSDGAGSGPGAARLAVEWSGVRTAVATGVVALEARTTAGAHGGGGGGGAAGMPSTVVGDAVNHALTLLGLNRQWGTRTVISGETAEQCRESLALRHLVTVATVGVEGRGDVFEVLGVRPDLLEIQVLSNSSSQEDDTDDTMRPAAAAGMASHLFDARRHTCAALLRKAQSTLSAEPRQVEWARCYGAALAAFRNGDYAGCLEQLDAAAAARAPQSPETVSEQRLREVCAAVATYTSPIAFSAVWESSIGAFI